MKRLGKYEIVRELGRGAMGVVYEARDPQIDRKVALKTIAANLADNKDLLERFKREAQAAGKLQHPNIVTIFELGEDRDTIFIAMEYLEGESLEQMIARRQPMPLLQKVGYLVQICKGLGYAHEHGVVHRDMKPANIMVLKNDMVKVVDFGIARLAAASSTKTGMMIGTVAYMSPEQVQGQHVDQRSDIWSVGVTFYELLTFHRPFSADNIAAVMFNIVTQDPKPIRDYLPDIPDELEALLKKIFEKKISDRYQSFEDVLLDLEPIYKQLQKAGVSDMVAQAHKALAAGEPEKANEILKQVIQIEPTHREARALREQVRQELARRQQQPQVQEFVNRAQEFLALGKYAEAKSAALDAKRLDSHYGPAQEVLMRIENAQMLEEAQNLAALGNYTEADRTILQVLERDPNNSQARQLRIRVAEERAARERRKLIEEKKQQARALWTQQKHTEAVALLEELQREAPEDGEIASLLATVRTEMAEQERQAQIQEIRRLLGEQKYSEAIELCQQRLQINPADSLVRSLLEQVDRERREHARRVRLQREQQAVKKLVSDGLYDEAIPRAEALLAEFPDDAQLRQLLELARSQKAQVEQERLREQQRQQIRTLLEKEDFDAAVAEAQSFLAGAPDDADVQMLLKAAQDRAREKKEREAREFIEKQVQAMQAALDRDDLSGAIEVGKKTLVVVGENAEVTRLLNLAELRHDERARKLEEQRAAEQLKTVVRQWSGGEFEEAQKAFRDLTKTHVFSEEILENLEQAITKKQAPTPDVLQTLVGHVPADIFQALPKEITETIMRPAGEAAPAPPSAQETTIAPPGALDEFVGLGKPMIEIRPTKEKAGKKEAWRPADFEETVKWTEPVIGAPPAEKPETPLVDFAATRVGSLEEFMPPDEAPPPAPPPPPADFGATTIGSLEQVSAPPPPPPAADFGATTIGSIEQVVAPPPPPPTPAADFGATTIGSIEQVAPPAPPVTQPPADFGATTIGSIEQVTPPAPSAPAAPPADFGATTIGKIEAPPPPPPSPPADFGATTIGKIEAPAPAPPPPARPPVKEKKKPRKEAAPATMEDTLRVEPKPVAPAVPVEAPRPEAIAPAIPVWKKPAVMAVMAVVLIGAVVGGYLATREKGPTATQQQEELIAQARQKYGARDIQGGIDLLTQAEGVAGGTMGADIAALKKQWEEELARSRVVPAAPRIPPEETPAGKSQMRFIAKAESELKRPKPNLQNIKDWLDQAEKVPEGPLGERIQRVRDQVALVESGNREELLKWQRENEAIAAAEQKFRQDTPGSLQDALEEVAKAIGVNGPRKSEAETLRANIQQRMGQLQEAENLLAQARQQAQANDQETLDAALRTLGRIKSIGGPRRSEAENLERAVNQRLTALRGAAATAAEVARLENEGKQLLNDGRYQDARGKASEIEQKGDRGKAQALRSQIDASESNRLRELQTEFSRAGEDKGALGQLKPKIDAFVEVSGGNARSAASRLAADIDRILKTPDVTGVAQLQMLSCREYTEPFKEGDVVPARHVDGCGFKLLNASIPAEIAKQAGRGTKVTVELNVNEDGRATGGKVRPGGNAAVGQALIAEAQRSWAFTPPRVKGKKVKTTAVVEVSFN
jgi:serine/threonine-protein kinase